MQNLPRISKQFQPMQRIPTKTPTVQKPCIDRANPEFSGLHNKKERQILRFDVQYLVHLAHTYPNFSLLSRLPRKRPFRTFLIIKGDENLIIVEIDGIDEGIHQCLPLLRLGHIQLAEAEQPSQSNFLIVCNIVGLHIAKYAGQSSIPNLSLRLNRTNSSFIFGLASRSSAMRACSSFR